VVQGCDLPVTADRSGRQRDSARRATAVVNALRSARSAAACTGRTDMPLSVLTCDEGDDLRLQSVTRLSPCAFKVGLTDVLMREVPIVNRLIRYDAVARFVRLDCSDAAVSLVRVSSSSAAAAADGVSVLPAQQNEQSTRRRGPPTRT
jgi:hypothetical protein